MASVVYSSTKLEIPKVMCCPGLFNVSFKNVFDGARVLLFHFVCARMKADMCALNYADMRICLEKGPGPFPGRS